MIFFSFVPLIENSDWQYGQNVQDRNKYVQDVVWSSGALDYIVVMHGLANRT